jgi:hypothetical protein
VEDGWLLVEQIQEAVDRVILVRRLTTGRLRKDPGGTNVTGYRGVREDACLHARDGLLGGP